MAEQEEVKKKKGGLFKKIIIIFVVVLILFLGGFIALLKFDVAKLGTEVIGPSIKNIPGATLILPEMPEEEVIVEGDETIRYETMEQATEILKVTENLLKEKEEEAEKLIEQIDQLQKENERLKIFEANFMDFEADKEAFDNLVVAETDSSAFASWYETIYPDNAASIYAEVVKDQVKSDELDDLVATIGEMKPEEAAAVLSEIGGTRLEMVATIIKHLENDASADILGAMDTALASRIMAYLYPEQ